MTIKIINTTSWIIKNKKRNSIWKDIFLTKQGAEAELKSQIKMLPENFTAENWKIEPITHQMRVEEKDEKDFKDFNNY